MPSIHHAGNCAGGTHHAHRAYGSGYTALNVPWHALQHFPIDKLGMLKMSYLSPLMAFCRCNVKWASRKAETFALRCFFFCVWYVPGMVLSFEWI